MDMTGEYRIPAAREAVWKALNDPDVLKQCIPGCDEIQQTSDTTLTAKVTAKVGPVKAKFTGDVTLSDLDPPNGYTISGQGKGGAAGFAKGGAKVRLEEEGHGTLLKYDVNATVGGKLAQIGSRLIDSTAHKMAEDFFSKFAEVVGAAPVAAAASTPPPPGAPVGEATRETAVLQPGETDVTQKGLSPMTWVIGLIVAVLIILALFTLF